MKTISVAECRKNFASVLEEVQRTGEEVTVTRRGEAQARIVPAAVNPATDAPLFGFMKGTITIPPGVDLDAPLYTDEELDGFLDREMANIRGDDPVDG